MTTEEIMDKRKAIKLAVERLSKQGPIQSLRIQPLVMERYLEIYFDVLKLVAQGDPEAQAIAKAAIGPLIDL